MAEQTMQLKLHRITDEHMDEIGKLFDECEEVKAVLNETCYDFEAVDFDKFKQIVGNEDVDSPEAFLHTLLETMFDKLHIRKLLFTCRTIIDNACDKTKDTIEYRPDFIEAFELAEKMQWIPTSESIPEPGEIVLVCGVDDKNKKKKPNVLRAVFIPKYTMEDNGDFKGETDYYEENDEYYWPEGWYEWNSCEDTHWLIADYNITHWMSLPAVPLRKV